jgi:ATP-binding cassette subfamily C protein LapB
VARALLLDAPIVIMDEPSNAMDNNTEEAFKRKLEDWLGQRTLVLVTHRASLLTLVQRIIVIDGGRVVADGPKEQVLEALKHGQIPVTRA